ncbi:hypothetical protein [Streptomyces sp. NRRL F-5135]|uniref:hypothetical protein n=1 Tax=Streptomyces sp. NRRL F-5135 TaxID=1463858 RepID=UPI00068DD2FF|nr:hypothetical protein [Streptomyces sp. NRRL F-5135]
MPAEVSGANFATGLIQASRTAGATDPQVRGADWRTGTVTAAPGDGTVAVGTIVARCLDSYTAPTVGDQIIISQAGSGNWIALGRTSSGGQLVGQSVFARKTANTTRASTATTSADPHLVLPVAASATYEISGMLVYNSTGLTGDLKLGITGPSGATGWWGTYAPSISATAEPSTLRPLAQDLATERTYGAGWSSANGAMLLHGLVVTSATAGSVSVNWSQNTSDAVGLTLYANSYLTLTRRA